MIRKWLWNFAQWVDEYGYDSPETAPNRSPDYEQGVVELTKIYELGNGYLMHQSDPNNHRRSSTTTSAKSKPALYFEDPQGIVDHLIQTRTLNKLNN